MDKTKNIQLAAFFNQLYKVDTIEELSELAGQMNSVFGQTIIAEDSIKNIESGGNADEFLIDLVRKLEGMVKGEDQSAFYDSVDLNLLEYFENEEEKKRILDERYAEKYLGEDDFGFEEENPKYISNKMYFPNIIKSIKDDKIKFEVLSKHRELLVDTFKDSQYPIVTINSIKDEEKRVELVELYRPLLEKEKPETALDMQIGVMQDFKDGKYRDLILSQMYPRYDLSNKDSRMSLYESIDDYPLKIEVAKGFDELPKS